MKIVYCIPSTFNSGGMERILCLKASFLADVKGYDVTIVTTEQKGRNRFFDFSKKIKFIDLGINYRDFKNNKLREIISFPFLQLKHKNKLSKILKQIKPDFTVSMFQEEAFILPLIKDGSKKIIESHFYKNYRHILNNKGFKKIINDFRAKKDERTIKKFYKFVTLTEEDKMEWSHKDNITVIPNPITIDYSTDPTGNRSKKVLLVGRFNPQKGLERVIEIWNQIEPHFPDWKLTIIGNQDDKSYVNNIKNLISKYNLKQIELKEAVPDILKEYDDSEILVMTSIYEGLPLSLIEGMSRGLPLIAYDCKCGPKEIIRDGINGYLIKNGDKDSFVQKLKSLMEDSELRNEMRNNALSISRNYEILPIMDKWTKLFSID